MAGLITSVNAWTCSAVKPPTTLRQMPPVLRILSITGPFLLQYCPNVAQRSFRRHVHPGLVPRDLRLTATSQLPERELRQSECLSHFPDLFSDYVFSHVHAFSSIKFYAMKH
jgi:hypothetical protein